MISDKSSVLRGLLMPLQTHLDDPKNTEILINRPFEVWTEGASGWQMHRVPGLDYRYLKHLANAFAVFNNLEITPQNPIVSGVMPDGQRGQVAIPSAVEIGTVSIVIRKPSLERFTLDDYKASRRLDDWQDVSVFLPKDTPSLGASAVQEQKADALTQALGIPTDVRLSLHELELLDAKRKRDMNAFIRLAVDARLNLCLVGATGSGKTTFTKAICDLVPKDTRIITIEDTPELDLPLHANRVHMFYKDVSAKNLLKATMRMKPDRIFLTELRGDEAYDYLNALNTGHAGSVTTVHANDCQSAFYRIGALIKQSEIGSKLEFDQIMRDVYTTIDVMMYLHKTRLTQVSYDPVRKARLMRGAL